MYTSWKNVKMMFNLLLDEDKEIMVAGNQFWPSEILRKLDPIAYREALNLYADSLGVNTDLFPDTIDG